MGVSVLLAVAECFAALVAAGEFLGAGGVGGSVGVAGAAGDGAEVDGTPVATDAPGGGDVEIGVAVKLRIFVSA